MSQDESAAKKRAVRAVTRRVAEARGETLAVARRHFKDQSEPKRKVLAQMKLGPATVPELAVATGLDPAEVLVIVATLRRFGAAIEDEQQESYFRYRLLAPGGDPE